jgi:DNA-binding MarR family transcriptional regulator
MDKKELELRIERVKEKKPEIYNDVLTVVVPFYMFHNDLREGITKIQETKYNITNSEIDVMRCLYLSKNDDNTLSPTKIYNKLMFTSGAITKVLKKLEDRGYVVRLENKFDKRSKLVKLTEEGAKVCKACFSDMLAYEEKRFSKLTEEEKKIYTELTQKLLH